MVGLTEELKLSFMLYITKCVSYTTATHIAELLEMCQEDKDKQVKEDLESLRTWVMANGNNLCEEIRDQLEGVVQEKQTTTQPIRKTTKFKGEF